MPPRLTTVILFVNMEESVGFMHGTLGLELKYQSPYWSEFVAGGITLALHPASEKNPAGKVEIGLGVEDLQSFYSKMSAKGVVFTQSPTKEGGSLLGRLVTPDGTEISLSEPPSR